MSEFTFLDILTDELEILNKRGIEAKITDFSILLGGKYVPDYHIENDNSLEEKIGYYLTRSWHFDKHYYQSMIVACNNSKPCFVTNFASDYSFGARPVILISSIGSIPTNGEKGKRARDGILEVEYGYYPQKAVSKDMQEILEGEYKGGRLSKTKNSYTTNSRSVKANDLRKDFLAKKHEEYEYNGKRYVRVEANSSYDEFTLSNGEQYKNGDNVWVEVQPVKWIVDEKSLMMVAEKVIFAGVRFGKISGSILEYDNSTIKEFMDKYLSRDLEQSRKTIALGEKTEETEETETDPKRKLRLQKLNPDKTKTLEEQTEETEKTPQRKSRLQKLNPDRTKTAERTRMTDTEIIQNWIEAGESVLLRGPSGIGKTERIKSLYPDLIYIKLTNNMFPEKVVGSVNLQTGQSIPPDFAKAAIMGEATEEERKLVEENIQNIYDVADTVYERSKDSDKKVVIMLDELLNVKPAVQSLVYTLVLNRMVEIGKGLKLPDNVVVVATGNQKKYSSVAEDLAEPLEKRFDHILDMEPKVGEWITEYAIPQKIHPSVIGYILSKYNNSGKSEKLQDIGYFYEEPEVGEKHLDSNGCKGRTNDPRGWTSISNTLYNFERNLKQGKYEGKDVKDIIQRSISSKLREEWSAEFFNFYNLLTLTPEEVTEGMGKGYTQADLPRDISERFAYMTALITADETQVESCREFIRKYCGPEYLKVFDIYWAGNDERKMEKISELQEMSLLLHTSKEVEEYAEDGIEKYTDIGKMYSSYLTRDSKGESRGKENERN